MKHVIVTGGTGFVGSALVKRLLSAGYAVTVTKRKMSDLWRLNDVASECEFINIDEQPIPSLFKQGRSYSAIIHTATDYGRKQNPVAGMMNTNVHMPLELMEQGILHGVSKFINTDSFFNIYAELPANSLFYGYMQHYILTKKHFLDWCRMFAHSGSLSVQNLIPQHIYGPNDGNDKFIPFIIRSCLENAGVIDLSPGEQTRDFIFISDMVEAYMRLLEHDAEGFENYAAGTGIETTIKNLVSTVKRMTCSETQFNFGGVGYKENETMSSVGLPERLMKLGWMPSVSLEEGLKITIDSMRAENLARHKYKS